MKRALFVTAILVALLSPAPARHAPASPAAAGESASVTSTTLTRDPAPTDSGAAAFPTVGRALAGSTTTTTSIPIGPPTTTLDEGRDVTGGGRFTGGFGFGGYDLWTFELVAPAVLIAETSDAADNCSGDTTMELFLDGNSIAFDDNSGPGRCSRLVLKLVTPGIYVLRVAGLLNVAVPSYYLDVEFKVPDCGNGIVELFEECDDGAGGADDCCLPDCTKAADATPCSDGRQCNGEDTCLGGACVVHALNPCPGTDGDSNCSESCSDNGGGCQWPDPDGAPCTDGLFCNGADRCIAGTCQYHNGDPCRGPDGDGNCAESCKESTDTCGGADPGTPACDDGLWCNGTDTCLGGGCSVHTGNPCLGGGICGDHCNETVENCFDPAGTVCRASSGVCDAQETCTGSSPSCPANALVPAGTLCRASAGACDLQENCTGSSVSCPANAFVSSSTVCRASAGVCDAQETCTGSSAACPANAFVSSSTVCRASAGVCDVQETCTGTTAPCPPDAFKPASTACTSDGNICTDDICNGSGACLNQNNTLACNDGVFCNGADTCSGGACTIHQGNPCPGADGDGNCSETCDETADNCLGADANGVPCDDGVFCNGADTCSGGACSVHAGNPCAGADGDGNCAESCSETLDNCLAPDANGAACNDGVFCNGADTCLSGVCSTHAGNPCPGADGDGNCSESCDETADNCLAPDSNGAACNDGQFCNGADTCASGACATHVGNPCAGADGDGNCSESCDETADNCLGPDGNGSACNDGVFCNGVDTCAAGACTAHAGDPCAGADGDGNCSESCNESSDNCLGADPNGSACNDGVFCNGADTCAAGACGTHAGSPCPGPDGDDNCSETCNETADDCSGPDSNGAPCNDGLFCNGADTCSNGTCSVHAGSPCVGADGDGNCSESCNEVADSCTGADPNGSPCNDGLFCNGSDTCAGGVCGTHAGSPCAGADGDGNCSESCSEAADNCLAADANGSACNDGVFCNGADTCSAGACGVHAGNPCAGADGDGNCSESCDETADNCLAADANGTACNDGVFCNGADTCAAGTCGTHAGNPCSGPDGDGNCSETCDETADNCLGADTNGSACDDGLFCNGADTCAAGSCTVHTGATCPGADGDGDCAESCSDSAAGCTGNDPAGSPCNDGIFCNGPDRCSNGSCSVHLGDPCAGPDGDSNCLESCNETTDTCDAPDANGAACNDGVFCDGADSCLGGACVTHAGNPCPGPDGDGNCSETCDETADACSGADSNGSPCNDGVFCNGADTCSAGSCSVHDGNPCQGADGDGDCSETCDETADTCTGADANGSACDDGLYCNGADNCVAGACGSHGGSPCTGPDEDADCSESCDEAADTCNGADTNGSACDDGLFCNGDDTCVSGACSGHAGSPCPGPDNDANCAESCSEAADACIAGDGDGAPCNDGLFCNGADTCQGGACSGHGGNPCVGADGDGNCSESCNESFDSCSGADPDGSDCDDGQFCNGGDSCLSGSCGAHTGDPCTGADGDGNCSESCSEAADNCLGSDPNDSACSDGLFCNGADTCQGGSCSSHTGSPCPGADGDGNCAESCDEGAGACTAFDPAGSACSDGVFCNGADTCEGGACTGHAGNPCPGADDDGDCSETCSEGAQACSADDTEGSRCNDGNACTVGDACTAGACQGGVASNCDDQDDCTVDACIDQEPFCSHEQLPNCPPAQLCGDLNDNGTITASDSLAVLRAAVGGPECNALPCICNANGIGGVTSTDALLILRYAVGSLAKLNCNC